MEALPLEQGGQLTTDWPSLDLLLGHPFAQPIDFDLLFSNAFFAQDKLCYVILDYADDLFNIPEFLRTAKDHKDAKHLVNLMADDLGGFIGNTIRSKIARHESGITDFSNASRTLVPLCNRLLNLINERVSRFLRDENIASKSRDWELESASRIIDNLEDFRIVVLDSVPTLKKQYTKNVEATFPSRSERGIRRALRQPGAPAGLEKLDDIAMEARDLETLWNLKRREIWEKIIALEKSEATTFTIKVDEETLGKLEKTEKYSYSWFGLAIFEDPTVFKLLPTFALRSKD